MSFNIPPNRCTNPVSSPVNESFLSSTGATDVRPPGVTSNTVNQTPYHLAVHLRLKEDGTSETKNNNALLATLYRAVMARKGPDRPVACTGAHHQPHSYQASIEAQRNAPAGTLLFVRNQTDQTLLHSLAYYPHGSQSPMMTATVVPLQSSPRAPLIQQPWKHTTAANYLNAASSSVRPIRGSKTDLSDGGAYFKELNNKIKNSGCSTTYINLALDTMEQLSLDRNNMPWSELFPKGQSRPLPLEDLVNLMSDANYYHPRARVALNHTLKIKMKPSGTPRLDIHIRMLEPLKNKFAKQYVTHVKKFFLFLESRSPMQSWTDLVDSGGLEAIVNEGIDLGWFSKSTRAALNKCFGLELKSVGDRKNIQNRLTMPEARSFIE